jgi:hypothetical protein
LLHAEVIERKAASVHHQTLQKKFTAMNAGSGSLSLAPHFSEVTASAETTLRPFNGFTEKTVETALILDSLRQWLCHSDARQVCDLPAANLLFHSGLRPVTVRDRSD